MTVTSDRQETLFGTLLHVRDLDVGGVHVYRLVGYHLGIDHHAPFLGDNPPSYREDLVAEHEPTLVGGGELRIVEEIAYSGDSLETPLSDTNTLATFYIGWNYYRDLYELRYESGTTMFSARHLPDTIAVAMISATRQHAMPTKHEKKLTERLAVDPRESID